MPPAQRPGRHRPERRGPILLLVWAAAGAAIAAIVLWPVDLLGEPTSTPAPASDGRLAPCAPGYAPYDNDEGDLVCVRATPLTPRGHP